MDNEVSKQKRLRFTAVRRCRCCDRVIVRVAAWTGEGDIRGHRPANGWSAMAAVLDEHPATGKRLGRSVWFLIETREVVHG